MAGAEAALCAMQVRLTLDDLASERAFVAAVDRTVDMALPALAGADHRLLVFPEDIGHFIPLLYAPRAARRQPTMTRAMAFVAARHPLRLARAMWDGHTLDVQKGLMLSTMPAADRLMRAVFADVARRTNAFVVAGTHLRAAAGAVTNTSYTFGPDGALIAVTNKVNLVPGLEDHRPGGVDLARGQLEQMPLVSTPFGGLATVVCYDGFFVSHTRDEPEFVPVCPYVDDLGARVIANPSANPWPWRGPWLYAFPGGPQTRDVQWQTEGLAGSMASLHNVRYGVTAHLCARILDFQFDGPSEILRRTDGPPGDPSNVEVVARAIDHESEQIVVARVPVRD